MTTATVFKPGGYAYLPGVFQYSAGVAALPGFRIERARFPAPMPLADGFKRIAEIIQAAGRPLTALCACDLRSPAPFSEAGFKSFNESYVGTLAEWEIYRNGANPVARSNVCPEVDPPEEPSFHAFAFTTEAPQAAHSFVIAGSAECPEGQGNYRDHIVARGDLSLDGLRRKAEWVLGEMERRMSLLDSSWGYTTAAQLYTVHDVHPIMQTILAPRGAMRNGLTWHFCRPPVVDLEFEMDCRGIHVEHVLE